jgi:hypothetical protein
MADFFNLDDPVRHPEKLYADDGLMDILLGATFIGAALAMWYDVVWLFSILPVTAFFLWQGIKERITAPRLTDEEIRRVTATEARTRQSRLILLSLLLGMLVLGLMTLFLFEVDAPWMDDLWPFIMMGIGLLVIALPAFAFGARRFYGYAGAALALWLLGYWLAVPLPVAVALPGLLMLAGGSYCLRGFLGAHPRLR